MKRRTFASFRKAGSRRRGRTRLFVLSAMVAATTVGVTASTNAPVDAPEQAASGTASGGKVMRFDIQQAPLADVLAEFERVTGRRTRLAETGLGLLTSPGVVGTFTPAEAMRRLLMGTATAATLADDGSWNVGIAGIAESVDVESDSRVTSPKYTQPLRDTPQTVVVIPRAVFQEQGATSLRDALRNTPGITFMAGEGGAAPGDNLLMRGFSARNDVYVDGARDSGVTSRDTFATEAIEVAKGPSSVTSGRGATGGSINLVSKTATLMNHSLAQLTAGSADYRRGTIDVNRRVTKSVGIRLNGMWQDAGVPRRDGVTQKAWGIAPAISFGLDSATSLQLHYQHLHQNNVPDYGLPGTLPDLANAAGQTVKDLDFSNFYGLLSRDHEKMDSHIATATLDHRFNDSWTLRNLTRYGRNGLDRVVTSPRAASSANSTLDPGYDPALAQIRRTDTKYQYRDDRTVVNQTDVSTAFSTAGIGHALVTGLEFTFDTQPSHAATDNFASGRPPVTDLFDPSPAQPYVPSIVATGATSDAHANSAAAYLFDTVKLSERWQIDLGGRFDRVDVDYDTVSAAVGAASFGRTDHALSGRAGVVFKPTLRGSLYAAVSTSFTPSYDGTFGLTLAQTGVNGSALAPERSHNIEVGTKWDVRRGLQATAAMFSTEKTNAKTTDASGATVLAGDQAVFGLELGLSGSLNDRWSVFSGIAVMDATTKESGNFAEVDKQLSYVPKITFNLWSTYRLPFGITLGGGLQYTDGYYFNNSNTLTTANAAAIQDLTQYWLVNAMGIYRVNRYLAFQVNGTNLGNERYVDRGYTGHFIPGAGRALQVGPVITF
jgi:catecholate siderophore receptor